MSVTCDELSQFFTLFQRPIEIQGIVYNVDEDSEVCTQFGGGNGKEDFNTLFLVIYQ